LKYPSPLAAEKIQVPKKGEGGSFSNTSKQVGIGKKKRGGKKGSMLLYLYYKKAGKGGRKAASFRGPTE